MRALIGFYLAVGVVLLLVGFLGTGECEHHNFDIFSNMIFVLGWPGYLYRDVVYGSLSTGQLLHDQACVGSVVMFSGHYLR